MRNPLQCIVESIRVIQPTRLEAPAELAVLARLLLSIEPDCRGEELATALQEKARQIERTFKSPIAMQTVVDEAVHALTGTSPTTSRVRRFP